MTRSLGYNAGELCAAVCEQNFKFSQTNQPYVPPWLNAPTGNRTHAPVGATQFRSRKKPPA